jgi:hypothetical protein
MNIQFVQVPYNEPYRTDYSHAVAISINGQEPQLVVPYIYCRDSAPILRYCARLNELMCLNLHSLYAMLARGDLRLEMAA